MKPYLIAVAVYNFKMKMLYQLIVNYFLLRQSRDFIWLSNNTFAYYRLVLPFYTPENRKP